MHTQYSQFEVELFLWLVDVADKPENRGVAHIKIDEPSDPRQKAAIDSLENDELINIVSKYLDGRTVLKVTGKGYRTAEALRAPPPPPTNPIGFKR